MDPFVHLRVASGYSLQYGASLPQQLVEQAVSQEMDTLALTDRNGVYGAVRFARACQRQGVRPVLGVDLALASPAPPRRRASPARGGSYREHPQPRVVLLAVGQSGWGRLCRLVSQAHLVGERGQAEIAEELLAEAAQQGDLVVLLGSDSPVGDAISTGRRDLALDVVQRWQRLIPSENLVLAVTSHRRAGQGPGSTTHAVRTLQLARQAGLRAVLTNNVRYATRHDAPTIDVLDAARRLVPLDVRHLDRGNAEGFLKSGKEMAELAEEIAYRAGVPARVGQELTSMTAAIADQCALDLRGDLGLGTVHFPEFGASPAVAMRQLQQRCESAIQQRYPIEPRIRIWTRLHQELEIIESLGYAAYFLTVAEVSDLIKQMGIRRAARGSGAGSLVNYLLGVSGVDPIKHGLLMERFLSPLRDSLPDIDIDVESARRLEVYDAILARFGAQRCAAVSMMETYRVRHAVRDVGKALGLPVGEIDTIAKSFPHIRARDARQALRDLPELQALNLGRERTDLLFRLVERLDGLPRHIAMHPCGVLLSDATLLDRTPVEASFAGYPMSQFDKDDVEDLGLLKLDVLGIRMQSAMAHAVAEIKRVEGQEIDLDDPNVVPFEDDETFSLISSARTLGCFQIESPGQRELVGKSGIESFADIIADISLFRPGPVKSDMITPYLNAKQGWTTAAYFHPDAVPILAQTQGVVVYHEQVIELIAQFAGCSFAQADEIRRSLGSTEGMESARLWFYPRALARGYQSQTADEVWRILKAFASFGFCKAHAAAFALPTYQSAWLKTHWTAFFLAGVLTHDPGMYPKRLILQDARSFGIEIAGLDVNRSRQAYEVERREDAYAIRLPLSEVKGISAAEVAQIVAAAPYTSVTDFWRRAGISRPTLERLILAGAFDAVHHLNHPGGLSARGGLTRRDLLLHALELEQWGVSTGVARRRTRLNASNRDEVWAQSTAQRQTRAEVCLDSVQLALDFAEDRIKSTGLPELSSQERLSAELEILGLDVTQHALDSYQPLLRALGVTPGEELLSQRSGREVLVAGVKVATQTPPIRSGRRVIFLTVDDSTGPIDATFFEDIQGPCAGVVFHSWVLLVRGVIRRTGRRGISLRATGCWELGALQELYRSQGVDAVRAELAALQPVPASADSASSAKPRRVLRHSSGFEVSPYADLKPAGGAVAGQIRQAAAAQASPVTPPRKLWHSSPGSSGG